MKRNGEAVRDPAYPPIPGDLGSSCCWLDDGRITSRGVDIEVSGEIVSGWQVLAGYTFNDNENKAASGRYSTVTPKHLFKLWSSYELKGMLNGLKLGGGITAQSSNYRQGSVRTFNGATGLYDGPSIDYTFTEPGRVLVDLFAQYHLNKGYVCIKR
nr:TonB-dependent receptor [Nitrosomonas europaea]